MVQLSHPYMTTGKTIALTIWTFVGKVMSLLFIMLSRFVIAFLPRSKRLLISWLQSPFGLLRYEYSFRINDPDFWFQFQNLKSLEVIIRILITGKELKH